jgi:two-component system, OmpR family, response regulator ChvI
MPPESLRRKRILIVDDEEDITKPLRLGLERNGYAVDTYNDTREAVSNFRPGVYDLVVSDIRMPGMDGFEFYREIKKIDAKARICFFTAFDVYWEEFHKKLPELQLDCFIRKPMSISEFSAAVGRLIGA